ncbi:MAG: hypothetical protein B7Z69_03380 [Actinobacteria bacterium 21-73-9]|nr:MAG: hypothetical protein B7Z69_03380 [Actinobacteria bacterium 21-73-9]
MRDGRHTPSGLAEAVRESRYASTFSKLAARPCKRGRGAAGKTIVMVVVEHVGTSRLGRARPPVVSNAKIATFAQFIRASIEPGPVALTDRRTSYHPSLTGHTHKPPDVSASGRDVHVGTPEAHRTARLLKRWMFSTRQGSVQPEHLRAHLDEFCCRFNRRTSAKRRMLFYRLLDQSLVTPGVTDAQLLARTTLKKQPTTSPAVEHVRANFPTSRCGPHRGAAHRCCRRSRASASARNWLGYPVGRHRELHAVVHRELSGGTHLDQRGELHDCAAARWEGGLVAKGHAVDLRGRHDVSTGHRSAFRRGVSDGPVADGERAGSTTPEPLGSVGAGDRPRCAAHRVGHVETDGGERLRVNEKDEPGVLEHATQVDRRHEARRVHRVDRGRIGDVRAIDDAGWPVVRRGCDGVLRDPQGHR